MTTCAIQSLYDIDVFERAKYAEAVAAAIRETIKEHGQKSVERAILIGPFDMDELVGLEYVHSPTTCSTTLGRVPYKAARTFEDALTLTVLKLSMSQM